MGIYYVRPGGSNTNTGTGPATSQAWATLTKALNTLVAGDICYVAPNYWAEVPVCTNSGASGNIIQVIADPWCINFPGMTPGPVLLSGMSAEANVGVGGGINVNSRPYWTFKNFSFQNINGYCFTNVYQGCVFENIIGVNGVMQGINITTATAPAPIIRKCLFSTVKETVYGYNWQVEKSIIKSQISSALTLMDSTNSFKIYHSIVKGDILPSGATTGRYLYMEGCVWFATMRPGMNQIITNDSVLHMMFYNSEIIANGGTLQSTSATNGNFQFQGCRLNGLSNFNLGNASLIVNLLNNQFENFHNGYAINDNIALSFSATGCYFKQGTTAIYIGQAGYTATLTNCRFYGVNATNLGAGNFTNTNPSYGEPPDGFIAGKGIINNGINGKSLMFKGVHTGQDLLPVHVVWIPCTAGVPATVKFKIQKSFLHATLLPYAEFGTTTATMADNTAVQELTLTYTHYKTELVPLFICPKTAVDHNQNVKIDDIKVA